MPLDATHDPLRRSWVASANDGATDFPLQNLPYGRFRRVGTTEPWAVGVAIGDQLLDLRLAAERGVWSAEVGVLLAPLALGDLNTLMARNAEARRRLRAALFDALADGSPQREALERAVLPQAEAQMALPCAIGDYTDFYAGIHHATAVGRLFRPDAPLLPNYRWVPIGYHGRASSVGVGGQSFPRPHGQTKAAGDDVSTFGPTRRLDYELELALWVGPGNAPGSPIPIETADDHLFGLGLLNDWSARDIQAWEYQPLGPFLAKNFATTVSPWIVTTDALAPFRTAAFQRGDGEPEPLPYLDSPAQRERGGFDLTIEAWLQTAAMRDAGRPPVRISEARVAESAYWTPAQLLTHHASGGCNLQPGDLLGSGTLSGPRPEQAGSLLELTRGGAEPFELPDGERRTFLEDGDTVILRGHAERDGFVRIGLGEAVGTVLPALGAG